MPLLSGAFRRQLMDPGAPHELYRRAVKLQDKRLLIPKDRPNLFAFNQAAPLGRAHHGMHRFDRHIEDLLTRTPAVRVFRHHRDPGRMSTEETTPDLPEGVTRKEYDVDNRLLMQSLGRSQPDFREGVKQKRYAVPLNPEANKPRQ